jgi:hypothetical protein
MLIVPLEISNGRGRFYLVLCATFDFKTSLRFFGPRICVLTNGLEFTSVSAELKILVISCVFAPLQDSPAKDVPA